MSRDQEQRPATAEREESPAENEQRSAVDQSRECQKETQQINFASRAAIVMVRGYQRWLSPILGARCRFYPSCSQYYILAVQKYGFWSGSARGFWRICRCHPFHPGGVDYP